MRRVLLLTVSLALFIGLSDSLSPDRQPAAAQEGGYEVWAMDQSNSQAGYGGKLYIYQGGALETNASAAVPEVIDLGSAAVDSLCDPLATGNHAVRPHMLLFNTSQSHAIIAFVASGHVLFMETASRTPVACIDVGAQAHAAFPSQDGRYVVVANQNGKLLQRITTDYVTNTFTVDAAATLNLATCATPNGFACEDAALRPDNAPICPVVDATGRRTFVTLRGGGMFVVDATTTPMSIIAEYDKATIHPNGCGGIEKAGKMYVNSTGGTAGNPTEADVYAFALGGLPATGFNPPNTPAPTVVFSNDVGNHDSHGMQAMRGRYVWAVDRFSNEVNVVDTPTDTLVNTFSLVVGALSADPAPDGLDIAPSGRYAFITLRGPCPLTANVPGVNNSVGTTPGVMVVSVNTDGFSGTPLGIASITNDPGGASCAPAGAPASTERADPHGLKVRFR